MRLIRHILSHLVLLLILTLLVLAYYYRPLILPHAYNQQLETWVAKVYAPALRFVVTSQPVTIAHENEQTSAEQQSPLAETTPVPVAENEQVIAETKQPAREIEVQDVAVAKQESTQHESKQEVKSEAKAPTQEANQQETASVVTQDKTAQANDESSVSPSSTEQLATVDTQAPYEVLHQARTAFMQQDFALAEKHYQQLVSLDVNNADSYGELGNLYYTQGKWKQAGEAYYQAAVRLLDNGQNQQVNYLYRVIDGLDKAYAEKLAERLNMMH